MSIYYDDIESTIINIIIIIKRTNLFHHVSVVLLIKSKPTEKAKICFFVRFNYV